MSQNHQIMRDALQLALNEIKALTAYSGGGSMTDRTLAAIKQALADEPANQHQNAQTVKPVRLTEREILQVWKDVKPNQDNLIVFYGNAIMDAMIAKNGGQYVSD